jgi:glycosyltransferase involved in cell wall biosynthesis
MAIKLKVKYTAATQDYSGYGEAGRNAIRALVRSGVDVTVQKVVNVREKANFGHAYKEIEQLEGRNINYNIKIIHTTPDGYLKQLEPMKYHIGHLFWETSKLPPSWVWNCNLMDEIWTGDQHHAGVFKKSGVHVPIYVMPQAIEMPDQLPLPFIIENRPRFLFYSIFQWIARKNPEGLLKAYWQQFNGYKDVGLLIKTYGLDFSDIEKKKLYSNINRLKQQFAGSDPPPVLLYDNLLARDDIFRFHMTGDCFVLPHRGEGWGIPQVEATLMEKPLISTPLGGMHEYISEKNYLPINKYFWEHLSNMDFVPWYTRDQMWADPNIDQLKELMLWAYVNPDKAIEKAKRAKEEVVKRFSFEAVGNEMKERLLEIHYKLTGKKD